jgi:hypothetical protein
VSALAACALAAPAAAQRSSAAPVWAATDLDSVRILARDALSHFRTNQGDSTTSENYYAYLQVGRAGRRLLRSLGRHQLIRAHAIRPLLDSLQLETEIRVDPDLPHFVLLMVRNPFRPTAGAVGFLYWYRGDDLRMQGVSFYGGEAPEMKVWWTGREGSPYSWGIVERTRTEQRHHMTVLSLTPGGDFWRIAQFDPNGFDVGAGANVEWVDVNGDLRPELLAWVRTTPDSLIEPCADCPRPFNELTFVEGAAGFELLDVRLVPSPITTLSLFVRLLAENDRANAARLLQDPAKIDEAVSLGWTGRQPKGAWQIRLAEPNTAWPHWLMVRHRGARAHDWRFLLAPVRGRWLIAGWENRDDASTPGQPAPERGGRQGSGTRR